ncbi:hypothetical protein KAR91_40790 [Candidatus Pacearchaeota archaeon]|nr:hypothetical protein [Candidatus Pacearchaeota archaeon]
MANLTELFPVKSKLKLSLIEQTLYFDPITLGKYLNASEEIGDIEDLLSSGSPESICKVAFFFMDEDSKQLFKEIKTIDITGKEIAKLGGYRLLLQSVSTDQEYIDIATAILTARGMKKEDIERLFKEEIEKDIAKKKVQNQNQNGN